jgi:RHS repeat-associated protein
MSGFKDLLGNAMDDLEHSFVSTYNNTLIFEHSILTANNHSIVGNTSLMHGRDYEPEVGLYYFRNRYYHPQLGRFLQQDPMGYEDSQNLYQAFGMNPVNFTDPFGENVYIEVTPSESGTKDQLSLGEFWYALRQDYSREDAIKIIKATEGYGDISDQQIMALEVGAITEPFEVYIGGAALMMFEFSPAGIFKDAVSLPFGYDLVSGDELEWWQKGLIVLPFVAKGYKMYKAYKVEKTLVNTAKLKKIRLAYNENLKGLSDVADYALKNFSDESLLEKAARYLNKRRIEIGKYLKKQMPFWSRLKVYYRNIAPKWFPKVRFKVGDVTKWQKPAGYDSIFGPSFEYLMKQYLKKGYKPMEAIKNILEKIAKANKEINKITGVQ